jgi:uncharacterized phage protein (TIGR02216 family)
LTGAAPCPAAAPLPWDDIIRFGLSVLRLPPEAVWSLTLPEIAAAARRGAGLAPPARAELDALLAAFPDER